MTRRITIRSLLAIVAAVTLGVSGLEGGEPGVNATVDFSNLTREWDGFGVNYVELAQSPDDDEWPQEYGGFSLLTEEERQEILDMIFGEDGLKPGIVKMFFDPFQQPGPGDEPRLRLGGRDSLQWHRPAPHLPSRASRVDHLHPDAFVVLNKARWGSRPVRVRVLGNDAASFRGYLTTGDLEKKHADQGSLEVRNG